MNTKTHETDPALPTLSRRSAIAAIGAAGIAATAALAQDHNPDESSIFAEAWDDEKKKYTLPPLPYAYDALEPSIDAETMLIHHDRHHAGYVRGANKALSELKKIRDRPGDAGVIKYWEGQLAFNVSGHVNHTIFWRVMAPADQGGGERPSGPLGRAVDRDFGSFDKFSAQFQAASASVQGSGWGWLIYEPVSARLQITQTMNHQNETVRGGVPLLGVDVWEHAYYLKYKNHRKDYIKAFMNVVNWSAVEALSARALG